MIKEKFLMFERAEGRSFVLSIKVASLIYLILPVFLKLAWKTSKQGKVCTETLRGQM